MDSLFAFSWIMAADDPADPGLGGMLIPMVMIFVVFYFLMLRPQVKERRKHDNLLKSLKKNDRVITAGGIVGTVASVSSDSPEVTVKVDSNTRIKIMKSHITSVVAEETKDGDSK